jgi:hypothetical protein
MLCVGIKEMSSCSPPPDRSTGNEPMLLNMKAKAIFLLQYEVSKRTAVLKVVFFET